MTPLVQRAFYPSVMIATPCKDGHVDVNYAISLAATCQVLTAAGVPYQTSYACTSSVDNARSVLATLFLRSECSHLLFVDDDMAWASDLPLRLLNEGVDIIGVPYRKKKVQPEYTVKYPAQVASIEGRSYMIMVEALGMGMTLIHRKVFEKIKDIVPEYNVCDNSSKNPQYLFFRHQIVRDDDGKNKYESEDFHFCRIARMSGFEIWAYADENVPHIGRQVFDGAFSDHIGVGIDHGFTSERARNFVSLIGIEK